MTKKLWMTMAATAVLAIGALFLAACGDDDNSSGSSSSSGGSDAAYVAAMCKAQLDFSNAMKSVTADDTAGRAKAGTAVANLSSAIGKMNPPADAKDYHNQIVKFLSDAQATIKSKGLTELASTQPPDPPKDVATRLDALGAKDKNCTDASFTFANN